MPFKICLVRFSVVTDRLTDSLGQYPTLSMLAYKVNGPDLQHKQHSVLSTSLLMGASNPASLISIYSDCECRFALDCSYR
jgi:hypothetical protein